MRQFDSGATRDADTNKQLSYLPLPVGEPTDPGNLQVQLSRPDHRSH